MLYIEKAKNQKFFLSPTKQAIFFLLRKKSIQQLNLQVGQGGNLPAGKNLASDKLKMDAKKIDFFSFIRSNWRNLGNRLKKNKTNDGFSLHYFILLWRKFNSQN